jgi:surface polysaccharide O-acyltransferase-like enzyme
VYCKGNLLSQERGSSVPVDLIRTVAIVGVLLLHAANDLTNQVVNTLEIFRWCTVDVYQSLGRVGVPLFVMLTGVLLLTPRLKPESMRSFFKKRWVRVGIPFIFWAVIYFLWDFLVNHQTISADNIIQGLLTGPYFQFWYIYMLLGLYLLTPLLRVVMAHADRSVLRFSLLLWFIGSAMLPVLALLTPYHLDANVLLIPTYVGYYLLGAYLINFETLHIKRSYLAALMAVGVALTAIFTYVLAAGPGGATMFYFQDYSSGTMMLTSAALFLLLLTYPAAPKVCKEPLPDVGNGMSSLHKPVAAGGVDSFGKKLLHLISENTLAIFFFHLIVIESLQKGFLGFAVNGNTINSIVGVPLMVVLTLFICLAVIVPLKRVPYLKQLIG